MLIHKDNNYHFVSVFDEYSGFYMRSSVIENGVETQVDPFMSEFPELLDIGIMGHCIHGKSGLCLAANVQCYQNGLNQTDENMSLSDFQSIVEQCKGKTFQFALGGRGDPDQHEHFEDILKLCHDNHIVVNFTSSGFGFNEKIVKLCKKHCGAVAISWYRNTYTNHAIELLLENHIKTNIHYVLSQATIQEAIDRLKNNDFPQGINAIIFLLHKPVGLGTMDNVLQYNDPKVHEFFSIIDHGNFSFKIGFDSCSVPALLNMTESINADSLDTCEGGRWSAYITSDMKMLPCSFDNQQQKWSVDLRKHSIEEAWNSFEFQQFRNHFINSCKSCLKRHLCMGGCPISPEIVLCPQNQLISKIN